MTVENTYAPLTNAGNGVTTNFAAPAPFAEPGDIVVELIVIATGLPLTPAPALNGGGPNDYTITGTPDPDTGIYPSGAVVFNTAPAALYNVLRARATEDEQDKLLANNGRFPAKAVEGALDRRTLRSQEEAADIGRALKAPLGTALISMDLPADWFAGHSLFAFDAVQGRPTTAAAYSYLQAVVPTLVAGGVTAATTAVFATTAQLLAAYAAPVVLANGFTAVTGGRTVAGAGGASMFRYDNTDTTTADNGGNIRVDAVGRRWKAILFNDTVPLDLFAVDPTGVTDCSTAVAAALAVTGRLYIPLGQFKFSVERHNLPTIIEGSGYGSVCIPAGTTKPCFILACNLQIGAKPVIRNIRIKDPSAKTCPGIWACGGGLVTENVFFDTLKYGIIGNTLEWTRHVGAFFTFCAFDYYMTCSYGATTYDPIGFDASLHGGTTAAQASEHTLVECWSQGGSGDVGYYQDNGNNPFDPTSFVKFETCKNFGKSCEIIVNAPASQVRGPASLIVDHHWFESRTGAEVAVTVQGITYPSSIIYSSATVSMTIKETVGLDATDNPVYCLGPQLLVEKCGIIGNPFTIGTDTVAKAVDCVVAGQSIGQLANFAFAKNVLPSRYTDAGGSGALIPSTPPQVQTVASGGYLVNAFQNGTGTSAVPSGGQISGCSALSIITGDGILGKCLQMTMAGSGQYNGDTTTFTGKFIVMSTAVKITSGSPSTLYFGSAAGQIIASQAALPADGKWRYLTFISSVGAPGADNPCLINFGPSTTYRFAAIQCVPFSSMREAVQFAESGLYINPTTL